MIKGRLDLTTGSVFKNLIFFVVPFLFSCFMQSFYSAVDMWAVGRFSSSADLAAVNTGAQVTQIMIAFIVGVSMGSTVLIGNAVGEKNQKKANSAVGNSVLLFLVIAAILTPLMFFLSHPLAVLMKTPVEALEGAAVYIRICGLGAPFIVSYNVISAFLRGDGNSTMPMMFVAVAGVVNIAGDLLLTGLLGMGVPGVAISTVFAQMVASVIGGIYLWRKGLSFPITRHGFRFDARSVKQILFTGLPIALQDTLVNISFILITIIANLRGIADASAVGVVEKLLAMMFLCPSAMMSALSAITSQNFGAKKEERAILSVKYGIAITAVFGLICWGASLLFHDLLVSIFTTDPAVIVSAGQYLMTYASDCFIVSVVFCVNGYLCGSNRSIFVFIHSTVASFVVRAPLALLLSVNFPDSMLPMGLAAPIGSVASIVMIVGYLLWCRHKEGQRP